MLEEEAGVEWNLDSLLKVLSNPQAARWMLDRVDGWQGNYRVFDRFIRKLPSCGGGDWELLKLLIREADKSGKTLDWRCYLRECMQKEVVDQKMCKLLLEEAHARTEPFFGAGNPVRLLVERD